jgi:mannose-6-phosphate isomerase-like protein (cupin superfamily)
VCHKVNLSEKLALFDDIFSPKIVGELNGQYIKVVKFKGEYVWHHHDDEDEMFLVLDGSMRIHFKDKLIELEKGEFIIVPRGVEHKPEADDLCCVMLFEPAATRNTGKIDHDYTIEADDLEKI